MKGCVVSSADEAEQLMVRLYNVIPVVYVDIEKAGLLFKACKLSHYLENIMDLSIFNFICFSSYM